MNQQKTPFQQIDYTLIFLVFLLMCISFLAIYSGTTEQYVDYEEMGRDFFLKKQIVYYVIGFIVMVAIMTFDYELLKNFSIPFYVIGLLLLIYVEFNGIVQNGSQRWMKLFGVGPAFQPSEFMKFFLIIALAHMLYLLTTNRTDKSLKGDLVLLGKILAVGMPPFLLILKQPDLGTALVIGSVIATMILVAGISWRLIFLCLLAVVGGIVTLVYLHNFHYEFFSSNLIKAHQLDRIYGWLNPDEYAGSFAYQTTQAILGIGAGQLFGSGFMNSVQAQSAAVPELHTDFIFAVIGEEFGFLGATVLLVVFFLMFYRMVIIALTCNNLFGTYLVSGIIGLLVFQVVQNIGMTVGLFPVTGLALPFISYGGTALVTNMIAIGIVLNVGMRTKNYMFQAEQQA
ncbi:rod shape-determining protein RodA [Halalkalibacterium halodurans]|jgi:rod shape-determining protein RodA|uniref:Cell cycle protein n=2 Tax=Halalkalibacterium halodurans TaxID=86665 RepID=A0A0M0KHY0_ALKHA|nr:rod shape-determining protein RodA [Halalkalibacterium halodurans]MED3645984.1 rod shape-determining protein RodA [Halalkalibacterium halodurans]TPE67211.1 rod shape-determining protein RodA [Halalkalibacterium halodurans]